MYHWPPEETVYQKELCCKEHHIRGENKVSISNCTAMCWLHDSIACFLLAGGFLEKESGSAPAPWVPLWTCPWLVSCTKFIVHLWSHIFLRNYFAFISKDGGKLMCHVFLENEVNNNYVHRPIQFDSWMPSVIHSYRVYNVREQLVYCEYTAITMIVTATCTS